MSKYSEKELLLLSNFMYCDVSVDNGTISEILDRYRNADGTFTAESVSLVTASGGLDNKQVADLFTQMSEHISNDNPEFGALSATRTINEGNIRGACFTDPLDDNPVVAFRGTGGSKEAWTDDVAGGFEADTKMQKLASDFIAYECAGYSDITVTGHSKGGNMAQYVTVAHSGKISSCVSFDGQGFSDGFMKEHEKEIAKAQGLIKSVSAYNDFVNILLHPIAGTVKYVNNNDGGADAHSSMSLLNSNTFDDKGNIITTKEQSGIVKKIKSLSDKLVDALDDNSKASKAAASLVAGSTIAALLDCDVAGIVEASNLCTAAIVASIAEKITGGASLRRIFEPNMVSEQIYIDSKRISDVMKQMDNLTQMLNGISQKIDAVYDALDYSIAAKIITGKHLERVSEKVRGIKRKEKFMLEMLELIMSKYDAKESILVSKMGV